MAYRFVDLSDYQAGLNVDAVAASVDGAWCKVGDWSWVARYGWPADDIHESVCRRFLALGKPVGSYLFVRPGWTSPSVQIDAWRAHCPDCTVSPMIDLEVPGTLTGNALRDWVDEALARTAQVFGMTPVLYWSNSFARAYGMSAPSTPHIPMVAEYHRGYSTALWQNVAGWESWAYAAYGGPDVPPGYGPSVTPRSLIWQWTSSAQLPGFLGLVDCDFIPEAAYQLITDSALPPASVDDIEAIMADPALSAALAEFLRQFGPGGPYYLADTANRVKETWERSGYDRQQIDALFHHVTDGNRLIQIFGLVHDNHDALHADGLNLAPELRALQASVDKVGSGSVDVEALAAKVAAAVVAAGGVHADVDEAAIAKAVLDAFRGLFAASATTGDPAQPASLAAPLPDPVAERRAAVALADLASSVFDTDTGVSAVVARQLANMRPAAGHEVTNEQIVDAVEGALADAAQRAAVKAASLPPVPPVPDVSSPTGDMGGQPNT